MSCAPPRLRLFHLHLWWSYLSLLLFLLIQSSSELTTDGIRLLSFKYSVGQESLPALASWNFWDDSPCSWTGVVCSAPGELDSESRVIQLSLPNSQLLGTLPSELFLIEHLQELNLSNNSINGSLPLTLFNSSELQILDLSYNDLSGELPESIFGLEHLHLLNLSDNAFTGNIPENITTLLELSAVSLRANNFTGSVPSGFNTVQYLDLSSNLISGSLPSDFGGQNLRYFNVSYNRLSGEISPSFAAEIPENATIDLSSNNLTGQIPGTNLFSNQKNSSFTGNFDLCGKPLNLCVIPSTISNPPPNNTQGDSPPAIAAIPKIDGSLIPDEGNATDGGSLQTQSGGGKGLKRSTIVGIVVGDVAGIGILALVFLYVYHTRKNKNVVAKKTESKNKDAIIATRDDWSSSSSEPKGITTWSCLRKQGAVEDEETSETSQSSDSDEENAQEQRSQQDKNTKAGSLVTVDGGEINLELETLLKASAYILGATGSSIMYKAVLEDGTALAVRRIGESGLERFRDFENQVRAIAKLIHPNLVKIRGFYWGADEKLIIYDFVPNGSLANSRYRKTGTSPCHLPWEVRLRIAKGVARGLTYIHDKKHVHGNLKPSNILLGYDMEPKIGDFGLERLVTGDTSYKAGSSARIFGSNRSTTSVDMNYGPSPSPSPSAFGVSPYYAPESLRSLKANAKWDVYAFGILFLELLTAKITVPDELVLAGLETDPKNRVLRMVDPAIRAELEGKEEVALTCLKLGFNCASTVPQKRPPIKEVLHVLEKLPSSSSSSGRFGQ